MSAGRKLAASTYLLDENGDVVWFTPDDDVPAWAAKRITNPDAWADSDSDSGTEPDEDEPDEDDEEPVPYSDWLRADLETEIQSRNADRDEDDLIVVEAPGNKPELIAALAADDAAQG